MELSNEQIKFIKETDKVSDLMRALVKKNLSFSVISDILSEWEKHHPTKTRLEKDIEDINL